MDDSFMNVKLSFMWDHGITKKHEKNCTEQRWAHLYDTSILITGEQLLLPIATLGEANLLKNNNLSW